MKIKEHNKKKDDDRIICQTNLSETPSSTISGVVNQIMHVNNIRAFCQLLIGDI